MIVMFYWSEYDATCIGIFVYGFSWIVNVRCKYEFFFILCGVFCKYNMAVKSFGVSSYVHFVNKYVELEQYVIRL